MKSEIIILNSKDKKLIRKQLEKQFGIKEFPDKIYFCVSQRDNVYIANKELFDIDRFVLRTSSFGLLFGTYTEEGFQLSIEGSQLLGLQANKNVLEVSQEQKETWLKGEDLEIETNSFENQQILLKQKNDFFGVGRARKGKIKNSLTKSRTLKNLFEEE
jgi:NOL1/NOP2/fmu family ribosome biogenesis protein